MNARKEKIRAEAQAKRDAIRDKDRKSQNITEHLLGSRQWKDSESVSTYLSFKSEVDTSLIVQAALARNMKLFVPKVLTKEEIELFQIHSTSELREGAFGIPEPLPDIINQPSNIPDYNSLSLILIPGLAFDRKGNRIGFGAGHYDRLLSKIPDTCIRIGLAFSEQIVEKIPSEPFDQKMDYIISEIEIIRC